MHGLEKDRIEPEGRLREEITRKGTIGGPEILRPIHKQQVGPGQQKHQRIPANATLILIDHHLRLAVPAKKNGTAFEPIGPLFKIGEIGVSDNKLLLGSRN